MENRQLLRWIIFFVGAVNLSSGQETVEKPTFPDEFQVEIQGLFTSWIDDHEALVSAMDASVYYDKNNNRAAVFYTYQKDREELIYNFDDNELLSFDGIYCTVDEIPEDPVNSFIKFKKDEKTGKKVIVSPAETFYFSKSVLINEGAATIPVYSYHAKIDVPEYRRKNCDVRHYFSRPQYRMPDCDSDDCPIHPLSFSIDCEAERVEEGEEPKRKLNHLYNFSRFKSGIEDKGIFQPPPGIYCNATSHMEFPQLPDYFSFSYDYQVDSVDHQLQTRVDSTHKKVWYHSSLGLIRLDEFDENGLLVSSRVFDFYGGTAFTIISHLGECEKGALEEEVDLSELTRLPTLFFQKDLAEGDAVYIGKRKAHGIVYDVWSSSITSTETDTVEVEEFFFSKVDEKTSTYQLSHVDIHIYERNPESGDFEPSVNAFYAINNFRYEPKEWKAFDVSACYEHDHKKAFKLEVEGPSVVKNSLEFENLLEKLYMKIIIYTNVSISRVSDLTDIHDGTHLNGFNGFILDKPDMPGVNASELEPDMNRAYELLQKASSSGKLNIKMKFSDRAVQYKIKLVGEQSSPLPAPAWAIAAIGVLTVVAVIIISCWIFYVFKKKKEDDSWNDNPMPMGRVN